MGILNSNINKVRMVGVKKSIKKSSQAKKPSKFSKTYVEMIRDCLKVVEDRKGLSAKGIQSWIKSTFNNEVASSVFNKTLKKLVSDNGVQKHKGHYLMTKKQAREKREKAREKDSERRQKLKEKKKAKIDKKKSKVAAKKKTLTKKKMANKKKTIIKKKTTIKKKQTGSKAKKTA